MVNKKGILWRRRLRQGVPQGSPGMRESVAGITKSAQWRRRGFAAIEHGAGGVWSGSCGRENDLRENAGNGNEFSGKKWGAGPNSVEAEGPG